MADLEIYVQSFDIPREVSVYADQGGINWWTKAWFNNRADGEAAVAISQRQALAFWRDEVEKDEWLEEHFPKPMEAYHHAIEQTKEQLTQQMREQQLQLNL